jgi:concanavalin A-like lectin/glucanase superfamily protein
MFFDGNLVSSGNASGALPTSTNPLLIGKRNPQDGRDFSVNGSLDETAIWDRALSDAEIAQIWNGGNGTPLVQNVSIEIKPPATAPVPINQSASGVIPVAILSSATFDATQVDPASVSLAGARVKMIGKSSKYSCSIQDVNGDGLNDLLCQVSTAQFMIEPGDSTAELEAQTFSGQPIQGQEAITIVPQ